MPLCTERRLTCTSLLLNSRECCWKRSRVAICTKPSSTIAVSGSDFDWPVVLEHAILSDKDRKLGRFAASLRRSAMRIADV
jgi:hypothetical protein